MDATCLSKFIKDAGISYKQTSNSYIFTCPRCSKRDKLYIRKQDGVFICFYCHENNHFSGKVEYALSEILNLSVGEIRQQLYQKEFVKRPAPLYLDVQTNQEIVEENKQETFMPLSWPFESYPLDHPYSVKGRAYLESRGIPLTIALQYRLRYFPQQSRVLFPVYHQHRLYGWQGRIVSNVQPKVLSSKNLPTSHLVMFEDRLQPRQPMVICEGPVDAIKAHLCGGNIATMGKMVGKNQIELLLSYQPSKIYLALDPDAANETNRLLQEFGEYECYLLWPSKGKKDLGELSFEEVYELFKEAPRLTRFQICVYLK